MKKQLFKKILILSLLILMFSEIVVLAYSETTGEKSEEIDEVTVAIRSNKKPLMYEKNGIAEGALPLILKEIFKNQDIKINFKIFDENASYEIMKKDEDVDFIILNDLFQSSNTLEICTNAFYEDLFVGVIRYDRCIIKDGNLKIGLIEYHRNYEYQSRKIWDTEEFAYYSHLEDLLQAVKKKEIDASIITSIRGRYLLKSPYYSDLVLSNVKEMPCGFVLYPTKEKNKKYIPIINKSIDILNENDTVKLLMANLETKPYDLSIYEAIYKYFSILFVIFMAIVFLIIFYIKEKKLNVKLKQANEKANSAVIAKSEFLSNMSHQLRTPLNAVMGLNYLLRDSIDDKKQLEKYIDEIEKSSKILLSIIKDILDMSAIENNELKLIEKEFSLKECINTCSNIFVNQCREKNITFKCRNENLVENDLIGDDYRIKQIVLNLTSNALKFTDIGGHVKILISEDMIDKNDIMLNISVSDNGIGMDEDTLKKIFDKFERKSTANISKYNGTGLGLSICKRLVDMMNGSIEVDSTIGVGSTFKIKIPVKVNNKIKSSYVISENCNPLVLDDMRILLAEDNRVNQMIAMKILKKEGAIVTVVDNGEKAYTLIKNDKNAFDVVLMDIQMPIINGYEATGEIRKINKTLPIFAMTANAFDTDIKMAINSGMNGHIAKPIDPDVMIKILHDVYNKEK